MIPMSIFDPAFLAGDATGGDPYPYDTVLLLEDYEDTLGQPVPWDYSDGAGSGQGYQGEAAWGTAPDGCGEQFGKWSGGWVGGGWVSASLLSGANTGDHTYTPGPTLKRRVTAWLNHDVYHAPSAPFVELLAISNSGITWNLDAVGVSLGRKHNGSTDDFALRAIFAGSNDVVIDDTLTPGDPIHVRVSIEPTVSGVGTEYVFRVEREIADVWTTVYEDTIDSGDPRYLELRTPSGTTRSITGARAGSDGTGTTCSLAVDNFTLETKAV